jgi:ribonuclease I
MRTSLDAHLWLVHGGCEGAQRCAKFATMVAAAEARNR